MNVTLQMVKMRGINDCLIYRDDIYDYFKYISEFIENINDNPDEAKRILEKSMLKS